MTTATQANGKSQASKRSGSLSGHSLRKRARARLSAASKEATTPRIAAAAVIGAAAAAVGFLASADRRSQLSKGAHDLADRASDLASGWLPESKPAPVTAGGAGAAPGA